MRSDTCQGAGLAAQHNHDAWPQSTAQHEQSFGPRGSAACLHASRRALQAFRPRAPLTAAAGRGPGRAVHAVPGHVARLAALRVVREAVRVSGCVHVCMGDDCGAQLLARREPMPKRQAQQQENQLAGQLIPQVAHAPPRGPSPGSSCHRRRRRSRRHHSRRRHSRHRHSLPCRPGVARASRSKRCELRWSPAAHWPGRRRAPACRNACSAPLPPPTPHPRAARRSRSPSAGAPRSSAADGGGAAAHAAAPRRSPRLAPRRASLTAAAIAATTVAATTAAAPAAGGALRRHVAETAAAASRVVGKCKA